MIEVNMGKRVAMEVKNTRKIYSRSLEYEVVDVGGSSLEAKYTAAMRASLPRIWFGRVFI